MTPIARFLAPVAFILSLLAAALPAVAEGRDFLEPSEWLEELIDDDNLVILEVRYFPHRYFTIGHIPGAINIVSLSGTNPDATWASAEDLAAMYADLPKDKTIVAYCHDGFRMSLAYMQLKSLGYEDVRLLNGGWCFWGNRFSLPVVNGIEPFDDDFKL
ncbi:MAG: sulfurtransferase [Marinibacterium sp.]